MATDVLVPTLGESITEATLGAWIKKPGDPVKADEPIASLETDKVAVEVPSPVAGTMGEHVVAEGDTVAVGALIARIEAGEGAAAAAEAPQPAELAIPVNPAGAGESPALKEESHAPHHEGEETGDKAALTLSTQCGGSCSNTASIRRRSKGPARTAPDEGTTCLASGQDAAPSRPLRRVLLRKQEPRRRSRTGFLLPQEHRKGARNGCG
jgi:2-oxoglutarate dehydrogenase E2 component (dihydrolipoamide succinyltransferase)